MVFSNSEFSWLIHYWNVFFLTQNSHGYHYWNEYSNSEFSWFIQCWNVFFSFSEFCRFHQTQKCFFFLTQNSKVLFNSEVVLSYLLYPILMWFFSNLELSWFIQYSAEIVFLNQNSHILFISHVAAPYLYVFWQEISREYRKSGRGKS